MARPKKQFPDLYYVRRDKIYAINLHGRRVPLGPDRLAAEEARLRLMRERLAEGVPLDPAAVLATPAARRTVAEVLILYQRSLRPSMDTRYVSRVDQVLGLLIAAHGTMPADEFSALHLEAVRAGLVRGDYARSTINAMTSAAKTAWGWCVEKVLVTGDRAASVLRLRALEEDDGGGEPAPRLPVDDATVDATLPHLPTMLRDAVELIRLTGMRPRELCRMRRRDVSTTAAEYVEPLPGWRVSAVDVGGGADAGGGVVVWLYAPPRHKTRRKKKVRVIAFGPAAQAFLARWLEGLAAGSAAHVFSPRRSEEVRGRERREARECPVYESQEEYRRERRAKGKGKPRGRPPGESYTTTSLDRAVKRACVAAGVAPWTLYQLRHGLGTSVAEVHGDEVAAEVLGHASPAATGRYTRTKLARLVELAAEAG